VKFVTRDGVTSVKVVFGVDRGIDTWWSAGRLPLLYAGVSTPIATAWVNADSETAGILLMYKLLQSLLVARVAS
jgi:hypothetical protein